MILGGKADDLLSRLRQTISKGMLHLPGPAFIDEVVAHLEAKDCGQVHLPCERANVSYSVPILYFTIAGSTKLW